MEISGSASLAPPALYSLFRPVPHYALSFESNLDRNRGILNTITRIALSFLPTPSAAAQEPKPEPDQRRRQREPPEGRRQNKGQQNNQSQHDRKHPKKTVASPAQNKPPPALCTLYTIREGRSKYDAKKKPRDRSDHRVLLELVM